MLCQINTLNTLFNIISDSPDDSRGVSPCNSANPTLGRRSSYKTSRGKCWQHFRWLCRNCCVVYVNSGSSNISTLHDICPILGIYYIIFFLLIHLIFHFCFISCIFWKFLLIVCTYVLWFRSLYIFYLTEMQGRGGLNGTTQILAQKVSVTRLIVK